MVRYTRTVFKALSQIRVSAEKAERRSITRRPPKGIRGAHSRVVLSKIPIKNARKLVDKRLAHLTSSQREVARKLISMLNKNKKIMYADLFPTVAMWFRGRLIADRVVRKNSKKGVVEVEKYPTPAVMEVIYDESVWHGLIIDSN